MTPSHAAYGLFQRLRKLRDWRTFRPDAQERVLISELLTTGYIVGDKLKDPAADKQPNPAHCALIEMWCSTWSEHFRAKYAFSPRDARAAAQLLKEGLEPQQIIELAERAWSMGLERKNAWACTQSVTLHGFHAHLNKIRVELGSTKEVVWEEHPERA